MAAGSEGDKTEEPTPRRVQAARRRGEIAKSRDLSAAIVLAAVFIVMVTGLPAGVGILIESVRSACEGGARGLPLAGWAFRGLNMAVALSAPPLLAACLAALGAGLLQTRGLIAVEALRFDPKRFMPSASRVVSIGALVELLKGMIKVVLVSAVAWFTIEPLLRSLGRLPGAGPSGVISILGAATKVTGLRLVIAAAALGAADYLWQRRAHRRSLMMTREEVKREYKDAEGDPRHKAERQHLHRQILEQRMIQEVRKADFIVVNPDHIAVAMRYDRQGQGAPVVIAKGERLLAEQIKEIAREAGVPIFRDVMLARSLRDVEEGDEIPEALYEAVAEILRVVYGGEMG